MADVWLSVAETARRLGKSARQTRRYADVAHPEMRHRRRGKTIQFNAADVERIAAEQQPASEPTEAQAAEQSTDVVRASDLTQFIGELARMARENGQLEQRAIAAEAEVERLRAENERLRRPWWKRWSR